MGNSEAEQARQDWPKLVHLQWKRVPVEIEKVQMTQLWHGGQLSPNVPSDLLIIGQLNQSERLQVRKAGKHLGVIDVERVNHKVGYTLEQRAQSTANASQWHIDKTLNQDMVLSCVASGSRQVESRISSGKLIIAKNHFAVSIKVALMLKYL